MSPFNSSKLQQFFVGLAMFILIVAALHFGRVLLIPIVMAVLVTFLLSPMVAVLQRRGLGRVSSVALVVSLVFVLLGALIFTFFNQIKELALELPQYKAQIVAKVNSVREMGKGSWLEHFNSALDDVVDALKQDKAEKVDSRPEPIPVRVESSSFPTVNSLAGSAIDVLLDVGLILLLVIFMLVQREDIRNRVIRLWGNGHLATMTRALDDAGQRISRYLMMQLILNAGYGVAVGVGLYVVGIPYAFLWGILAGLFRYVPYVGAWIGAFFPVITGLAVLPHWSGILLTVGYLAVLELVVSNFMEPLLYGKTTGISPLALLLAAAFWAWTWGPLGLLLATPITTCLVALGRHVADLGFINVLLGDEPPLEPPVALFQRLLAHDHEEAAEVVDEYVQEHGVVAVYDNVLLPALALLKHDSDRGNLTTEDQAQLLEGMHEILNEIVFPKQEEYWTETAKESQSETPAARPLVIGLPSRNPADTLALEMFKEFINPRKCAITVLSPTMLRGEMLEEMDKTQPILIVISSLADQGLAPARFLCKRVLSRFPEQKILLGCWGSEPHDEYIQEKLMQLGPIQVAATFAEGRDYLHALLPLVPAPQQDRLELQPVK